MAELADAADSKSAGALLCVGSTPSSGTNFQFHIIPTVPKTVTTTGAHSHISQAELGRVEALIDGLYKFYIRLNVRIRS